MKNNLFILFLFFGLNSIAQQLDYCDYFTLGVSEAEYEGQKMKSYWPEMLKDGKDQFSKFLDRHGDRFDYILFREHDLFEEVGNAYPDSVKIKNTYCEKVVGTAKINNYFTALSPKALVTWQRADTFSVDELMLTASRYFYCDAIDEQDTTIQWHICVGINGQNEYKSDRDLILLEAFSIEAIMHYLVKNRSPRFLKEFDAFENKMSIAKLGDFKDFDSYLSEIRSLCYSEMQNNADLKKKLLKYYKKNLDNLNFVIE